MRVRWENVQQFAGTNGLIFATCFSTNFHCTDKDFHKHFVSTQKAFCHWRVTANCCKLSPSVFRPGFIIAVCSFVFLCLMNCFSTNTEVVVVLMVLCKSEIHVLDMLWPTCFFRTRTYFQVEFSFPQVTLHYTVLNCVGLHNITLNWIVQEWVSIALHCIAQVLHCIELCWISRPYIKLDYFRLVQHCIALHAALYWFFVGLHDITLNWIA